MNQCVSDSPPNWPRCEAQPIVASRTDRRTSTRVESGRELTPRHHIHFSRSPPQPRQTTLQQSKLRDAPNARTVPPEKGSRPHPEPKTTSQRAAIHPNDHRHRWNQKLPLIRSARPDQFVGRIYQQRHQEPCHVLWLSELAVITCSSKCTRLSRSAEMIGHNQVSRLGVRPGRRLIDRRQRGTSH
jgi:hypothetical protein